MRTPIVRAETSVPRGTNPLGETLRIAKVQGSAAERRKAERALASRLAADFGVTFDLAFKAVRAGVAGRCIELADAIGDCRRLGFIAAVQTLAGSRALTRSSTPQHHERQHT